MKIETYLFVKTSNLIKITTTKKIEKGNLTKQKKMEKRKQIKDV